ncbi:hypothetical protein [Thiocapsa sp.]|uniref:hypothetical protein n=1 Tax=Thiocapsa sp. TaxID=2024551 RepID=UPI003593F74F
MIPDIHDSRTGREASRRGLAENLGEALRMRRQNHVRTSVIVDIIDQNIECLAGERQQLDRGVGLFRALSGGSVAGAITRVAPAKQEEENDTSPIPSHEWILHVSPARAGTAARASSSEQEKGDTQIRVSPFRAY